MDLQIVGKVRQNTLNNISATDVLGSSPVEMFLEEFSKHELVLR